MNPESDSHTFEARLEKVPTVDIPASWKDEILAAAAASAAPGRTEPHPPDEVRGILSFLHLLLWPHPRAWAALACVWVVISVLNHSGPRGDALYAGGEAPPERGVQELLADLDFLEVRNRLLAADFNAASPMRRLK